MRYPSNAFGFLVCFFLFSAGISHAQNLRLNQIQTIGTHNSYHIAPPPALLKMIRSGSPAAAESIDYTHLPLANQFDHGIRQIELDIYADPEGGLYSNPIGYRTLVEANLDAAEDPNASGVLDRPGLKIIHSPGFDYRTTTPTLIDALTQVRDWSDSNRQHIPIMILIELKESVTGPVGVTPIKFDATQLDSVDAEIRGVFRDGQLITPDDVRGDRETLRDAVVSEGWPLLEDCRGKILFALDNTGSLVDTYLKDHPSLKNRVMFVSVDAEHPAAGFMKLNDPFGDFEKIQSAVSRGFIVRTRADANTVQARRNDPTQRDRAFESGAQYVSTDYPVPDERFSDYQVQLPGGAEYRTNSLAIGGE